MEIIRETRGENVVEKIMDKQAVLQLDKVLNLHDFQFLEKWGKGASNSENLMFLIALFWRVIILLSWRDGF